jgi:hypothetical protein
VRDLHLRRKETAQPPHALDFPYLVGDALFELLVSFSSKPGFVTNFTVRWDFSSIPISTFAALQHQSEIEG